jgi:hypothetical protein
MVTGYLNLNNLVYPVASLEAADQLSHLKDEHERPEILKILSFVKWRWKNVAPMPLKDCIVL